MSYGNPMTTTQTATATRYRVTYTDGTTGGVVVVEAADKAAAAVEAVRVLVRNAKAYNAKWSAQGLPAWAQHADTATAYTVAAVRKAPRR